MKAVFTVKYVTNFEFTSWHAANDFKKKNVFCFCAIITQYTSV